MECPPIEKGRGNLLSGHSSLLPPLRERPPSPSPSPSLMLTCSLTRDTCSAGNCECGFGPMAEPRPETSFEYEYPSSTRTHPDPDPRLVVSLSARIGTGSASPAVLAGAATPTGAVVDAVGAAGTLVVGSDGPGSSETRLRSSLARPFLQTPHDQPRVAQCDQD